MDRTIWGSAVTRQWYYDNKKGNKTVRVHINNVKPFNEYALDVKYQIVDYYILGYCLFRVIWTTTLILDVILASDAYNVSQDSIYFRVILRTLKAAKTNKYKLEHNKHT